ncbi:unnamed protein product [Durusdinium trenchii]|uniref:Ion transport domain-containing protein n=1 Tax=Durusdinium trenchii TaxID=1381693 RepID=A0ABP0MTR8_9DINO
MRAGYSRISSESGGDEESNDDGADLEPLARELKDVKWPEFISVSEWSHRTRIEAMEIANELKALKTDITGGDKGKFDDSKVYDGNKEGFDKWTKRLNEIDAVQCVQYIELLSVIEGQESLTDLLHSLSLNMEWEKAEKALGELNKKDSSVTDSGEFELTEFKSLLSEATSLQIIGHSQLEEGESKRFRKYATTKKFQKPVGILRYLVAGRTEFLHQANFAVTPAVHLIRLPSGELAVLLKSLVDAGLESKCFNSVIGSAVLSEAVERTQWQVLLEVVMNDIFSILLLMYMGHTVCALSLGFVALFTAGFNCTAALAGFGLYAQKCSNVPAAVAKHLTLWNVVLVSNDIFSIFVVAKFLAHLFYHQHLGLDPFGAECYLDEDTGMYPRVCYIFHHPNYFSMLVLFRWIHLALAVLQYRRIGQWIVPVIYAVTRPASLYFMFFLCLIVCGSFHAYFVFPIPGNVDSFDYLLDTFLKMFRLEVLGDFDLNELEGVDTKINATFRMGRLPSTRGRIKGFIEDGEHSSYYHRGISGQFVILSLLMTVVAMNSYIGLLGELYEEAEKRKNQLFNHLVGELRYRHLCHVVIWELCFPRQDKVEQDGLYWMSYRRKEVADDE